MPNQPRGITRRAVLNLSAAAALTPILVNLAGESAVAETLERGASQRLIRLRERATGHVLYATGSMCTALAVDDRDRAGHWEVIASRVPGTGPVVRLRNRETGKYLATTDQGSIALVDSPDQAWSAGAGRSLASAAPEHAAAFAAESGLSTARGVPVMDGRRRPAKLWKVERVEAALDQLPRGGDHPWTTYQAQDMVTNGVVLGPSLVQGNLNFPSEASGKQCVRLEGVGASAAFVAASAGAGFVLRASIPDASTGGGRDGTITLLVNDTEVAKVPLTSRHCYTYAYHKTQDQWSENPASGELSRFYFDDSRVLLEDEVAAGDTVTLRIDAGDMGAEPGDFVVIDFAELEHVPAPALAPAGFYSITDFGAVPDSGIDSSDAIIACMAAVQADGAAGAWVPPGRFSHNRNLPVPAIDLRGAGMWHSELFHTLVEDPNARTVASASLTATQTTTDPTRVSDLAITGSAPRYKTQNGAIRGRFGDHSVFENLWIEHQQVGLWLAYWPEAGGADGQSNGIVISGCRIRNNHADGINLVTTPQHTTVVNTSVRASRDDQFAHWSNPKGAYFSSFNTFKHCRADVAQRGSGFAIYGGESVKVLECVVSDTIHKTGFMASSDFVGVPFVDVEFRGIDLYRCGGNSHWATSIEKFGAIAFVTQRGDVSGIIVDDVLIQDPTNHGIHVVDHNSSYAVNDLKISNVQIVGSTTGYGIRVEASVDQGAAVGALLHNVDIALTSSAGVVSNLSPTFQIQGL